MGQQFIDRFGMERVAFVLANTVQDKDWDGRISADNKAWAKDAPVPNDYNAWGGRRTHEYVCTKLIRVLSICSSTVSERNRRLQKRKSRLFSKS